MTNRLSCLVTLLACSFTCAQTVDVTITATPSATTVAPGVTIPALLYNGQLPGPVIALTQGQTLRARFVNGLPTISSLHWHGLSLPAGMDGVIGVSRPAVAPGQEFIYEFQATHPGTYWYHPHVEDQLTSGMYGAVIVYPANPAADPAYDQEQVIILHDDTSAAGGFMPGTMGGTAAGFAGNLLNGKTSAGQTPIMVQPGQRLRLRIINAGAHKSYVIALNGHQFEVTHADGHRVQSVMKAAIPIGPGERYDAIVTLNNPGTWSLGVADILNRNAVVVRGVIQYAGSAVPVPAATATFPNLTTGTLLSYNDLAAFNASMGSITATPNRNYPAVLGMAMSGGAMIFTINGQAWPNVTPYAVTLNDTVQLNFANNTMGTDGWHPMHIHGHFWKLMGTAGGTANPPIKDTLLIRPMGMAGSSSSVQFLAANPGVWVLHCHNAHHMMMGMMNAFIYGNDFDSDGIANATDWDPLTKNPVVTIQETAAAFALGGSGTVSVQALTGSAVDFFLGVPSATPLALAPYGTIFIDAPFHFGTAISGATQSATMGYTIPNAPILSGLRIGFQAVANVPFAPGILISTWQPITIH